MTSKRRSTSRGVVWPDGMVCPYCGTNGKARPLNGVKEDRERFETKLKQIAKATSRVDAKGTSNERTNRRRRGEG